MKKIYIITFIIIVIAIVFSVIIFKRNTLIKDVNKYLTSTQNYNEDDYVVEGIHDRIKGIPRFAVKISFKDEDGVYYLYGRRENEIKQIEWLRKNHKEPRYKKHIEVNSGILNY